MAEPGLPRAAELPPSPWIVRWAPLVRPGGAVLDLACGSGRHARYLARMGFEVLAVDRDPSLFPDPPAGVTLVEADLESGPWPFPGRGFDAIVVANYLHRPLMPRLVSSLKPGGVLVYETFARGNERFGKPSNPDFLLLPGELLEAVRGQLRVVAYEDVVVAEPRPAAIQRLCARRERAG
jgi:SAM-dependent methyltransferase